jgi:hypothetical protein
MNSGINGRVQTGCGERLHCRQWIAPCFLAPLSHEKGFGSNAVPPSRGTGRSAVGCKS